MLWINKYPSKWILVKVSLMIILGAFPAIAQDTSCEDQSDSCNIEDGSYNTAFPKDWSGGPAVLHLHGFGGSGSKVIGNTGFANNITNRGYALIAPSGQSYDASKPDSFDWGVADGSNHARDDIQFLKDVVDDVVARFDIDRDQLIITGFSRGGSMVWDLACAAPDTTQAYEPVAGGFWGPLPASCAGPVKLFHTHGFMDKMVPLEGRIVSWDGIDHTQGDIYQGLQIWRETNTCGSRASNHVIDGKIWRKTWSDCSEGTALEFALHPGGHGLPKGWSNMVLNWFEKIEATQ